MLKNGRVAPGTPFQVSVTFEDRLTGAAIDPDTVTFKVKKPCGTETSYIYGTNAEVQRQEAGIYLGDITPDRAGRWRFRWESTGTGEATVIEDSFIVQASKFAPYDDDCCWDYR